MELKTRARVVVAVSACIAGLLGGPTDAAFADTPAGEGNCASGEYCEYKNGERGAPVADWNGDSNKQNYNDYHYANIPDDSPNDEVSWIWNRDGNAQQVWQDAGFVDHTSCFPTGYDSTNTKGLEDEASSHKALASSAC